MRNAGSAALTMLHCSYDGPVPAALRDAARNGGSDALHRLLALAESRALDHRAAGCRAAACLARLAALGRRDPTAPAAEAADLAVVRATGLALRRQHCAG